MPSSAFDEVVSRHTIWAKAMRSKISKNADIQRVLAGHRLSVSKAFRPGSWAWGSPLLNRSPARSAPIQIPESWSREVAKNVANLPSPVEANASVPVGRPDVVPDIGFSAPVHLHPPAWAASACLPSACPA